MGRAAAGFQRREDYSGRAQLAGTWEGSGGGGGGGAGGHRGAVCRFLAYETNLQPRDHRTYLINPRKFQSAARHACTNATEQRARAPELKNGRVGRRRDSLTQRLSSRVAALPTRHH